MENHESAVVEFRSPWWIAIRTHAHVVALGGLSGTVVGMKTASGLGLMLSTWSGWSITVLAITAGFFVTVAIILAAGRFMLTRLVLDEHAIRMSGAFGRFAVSYDDVRLFELDDRETSGDRIQLVIRPRRGLRRAITLSEPTARECFDALRLLCAHAPAMTEKGETFMPTDPVFTDEAEKVLRAAIRGKELFAWSIAVLGTLGGVLGAVALSIGVSSGMRAWIVPIMMFLIGIGSGLFAMSYNGQLRKRHADDGADPPADERSAV